MILRRLPRREDGQAAAELVAVVPILATALLVLAQLVVAGYALWTAGDAARAGARADHVGGDAKLAALSALPGWLEEGSKVEVAGGVEVDVAAPALLPGVPPIRLGAQAELPSPDGDG